jgi:hypothetical protein
LRPALRQSMSLVGLVSPTVCLMFKKGNHIGTSRVIELDAFRILHNIYFMISNS